MQATSAAVYQTEILSAPLREELAPLLQQHYDEIAHFKDIPLNPNWKLYQQIVANGAFRCYTARIDGELVGYIAFFVTPSLHYAPLLFANQDVLYVDKRLRGSRIGAHLVDYAHDRLLKEDSVDLVFQHSKAKKSLSIGGFLRRLFGYELLDEIYVKRLKP